MIDEYHIRRRQRYKDRIDKFWDERPEGYKLCPECFKIFNTDGFPVEGSWSCSEWCFESCNIRNPIITRDSISRIYLLTPTRFSEEFEEKERKELMDLAFDMPTEEDEE